MIFPRWALDLSAASVDELAAAGRRRRRRRRRFALPPPFVTCVQIANLNSGGRFNFSCFVSFFSPVRAGLRPRKCSPEAIITIFVYGKTRFNLGIIRLRVNYF